MLLNNNYHTEVNSSNITYDHDLPLYIEPLYDGQMVENTILTYFTLTQKYSKIKIIGI